MVTLFFFFHPFFSAPFFPLWNGAQHYLFAYFHWKIVNEITWKIVALMAPFVSELFGAGFDGAHAAIKENIGGFAPFALNLFGGKTIYPGQLLLEFVVSLPVRYQYPTNPAIQSAWRQQVLINAHDNLRCCIFNIIPDRAPSGIMI